uniref:CSON006611 protein n=1 Tax=Culicoides sonorensis TaxID=179676 RepID=A0A336MSY1_CULSO
MFYPVLSCQQMYISFILSVFSALNVEII